MDKSSRTGLAANTDITDIRAAIITERTRLVATELRIFLSSLAPTNWLKTIPNPAENPCTKPTIRKFMLPVRFMPVAAFAFLDQDTISVSPRAYNSCSIKPIAIGTANRNMFLNGEPVVISVTFFIFFVRY